MELETLSLISNETMNPSAFGSNDATIETTASDTLADDGPSGVTTGTLKTAAPTTSDTTTSEAIDGGYRGEQCGTTYCVAPLYCCNASCGKCQPLGSVCLPVGCVEPPASNQPGDNSEGGTSTTSRTVDLFD